MLATLSYRSKTTNMSANVILGTTMDISKLKVPDLKKELKNRGLSTTGNKNELVERLQAAIKSSDSATTESVEDFDEDLLNEDDDLDTTESVINNIDAALSDSLPMKIAAKRKNHQQNGNEDGAKPPPAKKVVLNRNPALISNTRVSTESKDSSNDKNGEQKKVIKLSEITVKARLEMRAKKFDVSLSTEAKKVARAERFGMKGSTNNDILKSDNASVDVLKQRAERFGGSVSKLLTNIDLQERLEKRKQRFGAAVSNSKTTSTGLSQIDKKQQRLERFKQGVN